MSTGTTKYKDAEKYAHDVDSNIEGLRSCKHSCCEVAHNGMGEKDLNAYATDDRMKDTLGKCREARQTRFVLEVR